MSGVVRRMPPVYAEEAAPVRRKESSCTPCARAREMRVVLFLSTLSCELVRQFDAHRLFSMSFQVRATSRLASPSIDQDNSRALPFRRGESCGGVRRANVPRDGRGSTGWT